MEQLKSRMSALSVAEKSSRASKGPLDFDKVPDLVPQFLTHLPPPVNDKTRILAVCGCTDAPFSAEILDFTEVPELVDAKGNVLRPTEKNKQYLNTGTADPQVDGWFISDFYFFMNLLQDTKPASQVWVTSERPYDLLQKYKDYGPYLHGNPYTTRKVVLSEDLLLRQGIADSLIMDYPAADDLKTRFLTLLKENAIEAKVHGQHLLVLMFGHGDEETKSIQLGEEDISIEEYMDAVGSEIKTTLFTTACYSGGWVVRQDLNVTTLAAAGPENASLSWNASASLQRFCGSVYATAFIKAWQEECQENLQKRMDAASFKKFTKDILSALFHTDRLWKKHDIRFNAQDDNWGSIWHTVSGFPLTDIKARYDKLVDYPATADAESMMDRDPYNPNGPPSDDDDALVHSAKGMRERFGAGGAAVSRMQKQAYIYFNSYPGADNVPDNTGEHTLFKALIAGKISSNALALTRVDGILSYRMQLSPMATELLAAAGIAPPEGKRRCEFNVDKFETQVKKSFTPLRKAYETAITLCYSNVLPRPVAEYQGRPWNRPHRYIAAGCAYAAVSGDINAPTVQEAVKLVEKAYEANFKSLQHEVEKETSLRGRKRDLWSKLGKRLRTPSPKKDAETKRKRRSTLVSAAGLLSPLNSPPKLAPGSNSSS